MRSVESHLAAVAQSFYRRPSRMSVKLGLIGPDRTAVLISNGEENNQNDGRLRNSTPSVSLSFSFVFTASPLQVAFLI